MKRIFCSLLALATFSCGGKSEKSDQNTTDELNAQVHHESEEENTRLFIEDYIKAANSSDWKTKTIAYLRNPDGFLEEHSVFRKSFPDYRSTIKHLTVDGNEGMVWLSIEATYAETFAFKNSSYGDGLLRNIEAENQELAWEETWYFIVVDGKFGKKFDILKDNYAVLKGLGAIE